MSNALLKKIDQAEGTDLQKKVWRALCAIPEGKTITYKELAKKVGKPAAIRAVASACGKNPFAPDVPCHRVVGSNGSMGGYSGQGGIATKIRLLKKEGAL